MVNLWSNSTFETSTDPWIAVSGSATPILSDYRAHGGTRSLYCSRGSGTSNLYASARIDTSLPFAGTYTAEVYFYVPAGVAGANGMRLAGTGTTAITATTELRGEWVQMTHEFTWDGVGTVFLYAYGTDQASRLYLDDLTIDDGTTPPEPAPVTGSGIGCTVYTRPSSTSDLVRLADGSPTDNPYAPNVLSDLKISWGRDNTLDQPAASTCSFQILDPTGGPSFQDLLTLGTPIVVTADAPEISEGGTGETVTVYAGRVVSMKHAFDDTAGAPVLTVDTVDFTADLENTVVGDEPWYAEGLAARFGRIAALTTLTEWTIDDSVSSKSVGYRDVDAQGAMGLLSELASSVAGVLWSATSADGATTRLYLEDPRNRPANVSGTAVYLSACDVLQDGVEWVQDVQDVITRAAVSWKEQDDVDGDGKISTTDRTTNTIHQAREAEYGQRGISLSTQLIKKTDAQEVGQELVSRGAPGNWRISNLTIDDAINDPGPSGADISGAVGFATNHIPDPSGEYDGIDWTGSTDPNRQSGTSQSHTGQYSYWFTQASPATAVGVQVPEGATTITVAAWYAVMSSGVEATFQMRVGGSGATTTTSPVYNIPRGVYNYERFVLTAPAIPGGTAYFYPVYAADINYTGSNDPSIYEHVILDDLSLTFDTTEPADFNGDTPDDDNYVYSWTGDAGASTSTRLTRGSSEEYTNTLTTILDSNRRNGLPIQLTDLPAWTLTGDTSVYLEGGDYTFTQGAWVLDLTVSKPT